MDKKLFTTAYRQMLFLRLSEERLVKEYLAGNRRSFLHTYIGQEAVAVGTCLNLTNDDYVFGNHRSHGHYLAKGGDLGRMIAELYGKATGAARGRGGSMHLIDKSVGFMGTTSILGSIVPIATGAAMSIKLQEKGTVCVVFFGDGASEEGAVYESMNFAALYKLPILFVVENNLYAVMTDASARRAKDYNLEEVTTGLGLNYFKSDGNNVIDVYDTTQRAIEKLKETGTPSVIEAVAFRHMAHSGPILDDKAGYRQDDPLEVREKKSPIIRLKTEMLESGLTTETELDEIEDSLLKIIDDAVQFAEESPYPNIEEMADGLYHE
jgi:TPP-dependent pyruvate/acetoin dehydrogenase alpha subunit